MQINTMISQLAGGMLVSTEIFVVTLVFSLHLGLLKRPVSPQKSLC